jgi:hypothetical protein
MPWTQSYRQNGSDVVKHTVTWLSDAGGSATVASGLPVSGKIVRVVIIPAGAPDAPTNLYDLTLTDSDGVDVLAGQGANALEATIWNLCPGTPLRDGTTVSVVPMVVDGVLTLNVTNAGDSKRGTVVVYVR